MNFISEKKNWIIFILIIAGIGWAAYDDLSKKDPNWIVNKCNPGLESSVHQKDDGSWVVGIRSHYAEPIKTFVRINSNKDDLFQIEYLRPAETIYLDGSKLKNPEKSKVVLGPTFTVHENGKSSLVLCDGL